MSLAKLLKLVDSTDPSSDSGQWLKRGAELYLNGGCTLDECLGLGSEGGAQLAEIRRNRELRNAAKYIPGDLKPSQRAEELTKEIKRFDLVIWPRWKLKPEPPQGASKLRRHLFFARRFKPLPGSKKQIYRIITA